jgi:hypothetical protein
VRQDCSGANVKVGMELANVAVVFALLQAVVEVVDGTTMRW